MLKVVFVISATFVGMSFGGHGTPIHLSKASGQPASPAFHRVKAFQKVRHPNDIINGIGTGGRIEPPRGETRVSAVLGSSVSLPCNITPPVVVDKVRLVLFFRNDSNIPIYTYDTRGQSHMEARHWSDENILGGRAFFRGDQNPARLVLDNVQPPDGGMYRCRVDFYKAPTTIESMVLDVIVPPEKPKIYDERGQEVRVKLGPYQVGESVALKCVALGGHPAPQVTWWRDHALIDDTEDDISDGKVINELRLIDIDRDDLHSMLTCQASNNNISVPVQTAVKLDMHFGPLDVKMIGRKDPVSAGRVYEFKCQAVGARPPPVITWWRGSTQLRENVTNKTSPDGNVTLSIINYVPSVRDAGKYMSCKAENPELPDSSLEDGWKLEIHYVPQSILSLGTSLNGSNIKEGDDVYFECNVRANPRPYKITWRFNENPLLHNHNEGILVSNQSLVLQNVQRHQSGIYTCVAHNIEGDGVSNPMTLNIRYAPYCKPDQVQVFGVAREESIQISCEVVANPVGSVSFEWRFNASGEMVDMPHDRFKSSTTKSVVKYIPHTELDYGSLLCWAKNSIGKMAQPCIFHLIPAGIPDPVRNCSFGNQTTTSFQVRCGGGYDGGLPQSFVLEAQDSLHREIVSKIQNVRPEFNVTGLRPGASYVLSVYSQNAKGASRGETLVAFTTKEAEKHTAGSTHRGNASGDGITVTPILGILVAIGCGLALVAVAIIIVLRVRPSGFYASGPNGGRRKNSGIRRTSNVGLGQAGTYTAGGAHIPLSTREPQEETIDLEEKEPDLIPQHKDLLEDEAAFHGRLNGSVRHQMNRYNSAPQGCYMAAPPASATLLRRKTDDDDYERKRKLKNNFSRLSQEVTYAELTMPRNKGYAQMRAAKSIDSESPMHNPATTSSFKIERPRPQPPPRYTATPTSAADHGSGFCSAEMPLVSSESRRRSVSSLPSVGKKSRPSIDEGAGLSPTTPEGPPPPAPQEQPMRRMKMKNRRTHELMDRVGGGTWGSVPETIGEEDGDGQEEAVHPAKVHRSMTMDIHEKRKMMMSKFKEHNTVTQTSSPERGPSPQDPSVPTDLLQKRKVLMKTLNQVRSQWSSMPAIDPKQTMAAMRLVQQQQQQQQHMQSEHHIQQQLQQQHQLQQERMQRHESMRRSSMKQRSSRPPPLDNDHLIDWHARAIEKLQQQNSIAAMPITPPPNIGSGSSRRALPQVPPVRRIRSTGHFNLPPPQVMFQQQPSVSIEQQQQQQQQQYMHDVGGLGGGGYDRVISGLSRGKSMIVTNSGRSGAATTTSTFADSRLLADARRATMISFGSLGQAGPQLSTIHSNSMDSNDGDLM